MKLVLMLLATLLLTTSLWSQDEGEEDEGPDAATIFYIGVKDCAKCHKKKSQGAQFRIWEETAHANAYATLKTPEAVKIAREKGLAAAPHEAAECLKCHATGYDAAAEMTGDKFSIEEGVQCETCHGAGSLYKKKKVMKSREESIAKGMTPVFVDDGSAEKQCLECHNEESPTFKGFTFAESWDKIKHPVPD